MCMQKHDVYRKGYSRRYVQRNGKVWQGSTVTHITGALAVIVALLVALLLVVFIVCSIVDPLMMGVCVWFVLRSAVPSLHV
jgi:tetrahydromethanopterin S-methyltransferase subunit F